MLAEVADEIARKLGTSKAAGRRALDAVCEVMARRLGDPKHGLKFTVPGLGTLRTTTRAAGVGRNPRTGEPLTIPAAARVTIKLNPQGKAALRHVVAAKAPARKAATAPTKAARPKRAAAPNARKRVNEHADMR